MNELLVHIGAPATRKNDDMYRSLADAYLEFESCQPESMVQEAHDRPPEQRHFNVQKERDRPLETETQHDPLGGFISTTSKESYGSFPSHVSSGTSHHILEPRSSTDHTDGSSFETSRLGQLERIQRNFRRRQGPRSSALSSSPRGTSIVVSSRSAGAMFIDDSQIAAKALQSQLPDALSVTSEDTSEDELDQDANALHPLLLHEETPSSLSSTYKQPAKITPTSAISIAAGCIVSNGSSPTVEATSSSQQVVGVHDIHSNAISSPLDLGQFPFEVLPPAPGTSIKAPDRLPSQMTKYLSTIKKQNPGRFNPSKRLRPLDDDERGYWLVECTNWSQQTQYDFWSSLCEYVLEGRLGWGVFLHREPRSPTTVGMQKLRGLGQVRLYCWGEIVEEVWLALWLCSGGKIVGSGSRWLDAGDAVIIQVS